MSVRYSKDPQVDRTLRHSVRDGIAYSVMSGGAETYLSAFALLLKTTAPQVALIATLPPLLGSLAQLLSAWLVGQLRERKRLILAGASLQTLVWLPLLLLPLLFPQQAVLLLVACATLYHASGNFCFEACWTLSPTITHRDSNCGQCVYIFMYHLDARPDEVIPGYAATFELHPDYLACSQIPVSFRAAMQALLTFDSLALRQPTTRPSPGITSRQYPSTSASHARSE